MSAGSVRRTDSPRSKPTGLLGICRFTVKLSILPRLPSRLSYGGLILWFVARLARARSLAAAAAKPNRQLSVDGRSITRSPADTPSSSSRPKL